MTTARHDPLTTPQSLRAALSDPGVRVECKVKPELTALAEWHDSNLTPRHDDVWLSDALTRNDYRAVLRAPSEGQGDSRETCPHCGAIL